MNSKLATISIISPNKSTRTIDGKTYGIDTITIHCMAAPWTAKRCGEYFASRDVAASSNYGVGKDGDIALYVPETMRSWASSNRVNDARAITIEVACEYKHPYKVTDAALNSLIKLCADICQRNGIKSLKWKNDKRLIGQVDKQNLTVHRWFSAKACPGDYLMGKMPYIADEVNKLLKESKPMTDYEKEFAKAIELGITDGTNPDAPCTRRQAAVMVLRAVKLVLSLIGKVEV